MPVADLFAMAFDVINPSFQSASYGQNPTCFSPMAMQIQDTNQANIGTIFSAYGSAARGSICSL